MFDESTWDSSSKAAGPSEEDELDEFFAGGGGPKGISWKDAKIGQSIQGIITKVQLRNKTNEKTGAVEMNQYGKPKKVLILTLLTDLRSSEIENDNGLRRAFLQGNAQWEFKQFLTKNKITKPVPGGRFKQTLVGTKPTQHFNDQNLFECLYAPPTADTLAKIAELERTSEPEWGGAQQTTTSSGGATTLDSMRASGNRISDSDIPF